MLAGVYLSFGPLLGLGLFPELFTNWNCLSFLSTDLLRSSWIEPSPRSSPPSFPFLLRSISFFFLPSHCSPFWPAVLLNGVGPLKRNITSATLSLVPDTGPGVVSVWTPGAYTSLYLRWNELLWVECLCLNLVMLAEVKLQLLHFSLLQTPSHFGRHPNINWRSYSV